MQKTLLAIVLAASFPGWILAQEKTEGIVVYEHKINMHKRMTDESMKAMVPEFRTMEMQLNFRDKESLYLPVPKEDDESETGSNDNGNQVRVVIKTPQNEVYRNYAANEKIELQELAGQKFLIADTLSKQNWKITGETKQVNGYDCMKATMTSPETKQVTNVWFTSSIPVPHGPVTLGGLPGLILEMDINDGETLYKVKKLDFRKLEKESLRRPSGGKKVTSAEFRKKREEWMKEMGLPAGGGGGGNIKIIRN